MFYDSCDAVRKRICSDCRFQGPGPACQLEILGRFLSVSGQLTPLLFLTELLYLNCTPATLTPLLIGRMV
jgi:hypothetical protein